MTHSLTVHMRQGDIVVNAEHGQTILAVMQRAAFTEISAPCGGKSVCGKCLIRAAGGLSPVSETERPFVSEGMRLACCAAVSGDCEVWIAEKAEAEAAICRDGNLALFDLEPNIPVENGNFLGAAIDIGSTTVAVYLYDLRSGALLESVGALNNQRVYGADVISRIHYENENPNGLEALTNTLRRQIDGLISGACYKAGMDYGDIGYVSVCGNTIMEHFFAGLSPASIAAAPFTPVSLFGHELTASELEITSACGATVYIAEAVSGYIGGDITCGILASGMYESKKHCLFIDIGTNGEMAIGGKNGIICCATAAGPAFEGAGIKCGMNGTGGAISHVRLINGGIALEIIGGTNPAGICGSGLVDVLAVMLELGAVDETGRLLPPGEAPEAALPYLSETPDGCVFYIDEGRTVYITEKDVRQIQLAKAAIAGGVKVLISSAGIEEGDIETVFLAGGFGNYIDTNSAVKIGLIPRGLSGKIVQIGNAAGMGASAVLLSKKAKLAVAEIRQSCEYVELSGSAEFMDAYIDAMSYRRGEG